MPPEGFEPTISAGERLHTHALDRVASEIVNSVINLQNKLYFNNNNNNNNNNNINTVSVVGTFPQLTTVQREALFDVMVINSGL
jgi:hypothetical protein